MHGVEEETREHRQIDAARLLIEEAPLHRRLHSAEAADEAMIAFFEEPGGSLKRELDVISEAVVQIETRRGRAPIR